MGMNPKIWGPALWTSLICIVNNYSDNPTIDEKNDYRKFFLSLGHVLPCEDCRKNYCDHIKIIPIDNYLDGKPALMNWLWLVHNQVNDFCGKARITQSQFIDKYSTGNKTMRGGGYYSLYDILLFVFLLGLVSWVLNL